MIEPIENKEIRGITGRLIWTGISGVVVIVGTVMGTYFNLKSQLQDQNKIDTVQDMIINNVKASQEMQAAQIKEMNIRLNDMEYRVRFIESTK